MNYQDIEFPDVAEAYRRDPKLRKEDLKVIKEWLTTQPHLPQLTEHQIIWFLHSGYYEVPAATKTIEKYFTFKSTSDMFKSVDEDLIRRVFATFFMAFLPKKTPDGNVIFLMRLLDPSIEKYNHLEQIKVLMTIMTLYFHQHGPADGLILVFDMEGNSLSHFIRMSMSAIRQLIYFVQEAVPLRLKSAHHINVVPITGHFVSAVRPFIKKHIYNLMRFHYSLDSFFDVIPKECFPEEYGGSLPSIRELQEKNLRNILDHWDILQWHDTQRVDESKRERRDSWLLQRIQNIFS